METKTGSGEIGVTMMGTEVTGLTDATIVQDITTGIQDIVVTGEGTTGMTEADIEETVGQGQGPPEGDPDPERGTTGDGDGLKKGCGMMVTPTSDDGQITK